MSTAVVAILASSTVAIASLVANVRQHAGALAHDRRMTDLRDTRAVLDDAANALAESSVALSGLERGLLWHGAFVARQDPMKLTKAEEAGERLKVIRGRLAMRLKVEHPALS